LKRAKQILNASLLQLSRTNISSRSHR
jgi:hypothetical protein